jgi:hypothetical protein
MVIVQIKISHLFLNFPVSVLEIKIFQQKPKLHSLERFFQCETASKLFDALLRALSQGFTV